MKNYKRRLSLILALFLFLGTLHAENKARDVLFLKNGSIIKGLIVELIPDTVVKIQTADGSMFVYAMTEVAKIEKEIVAAPQMSDSTPAAKTDQEILEFEKPKFSLFGGLALPVGDFAEKNNGSAKTGFTFGFQYAGPGQIGFLLNASYSSNSTELGDYLSSSVGGNGSSSNWNSFLLLTGLKIGTTNSVGANFIVAPLLGLNVGVSPKIEFTIIDYVYQPYPLNNYGSVSINMSMSSATSTALAYGMMVEMNVGRITLGARYVASKPKYEVTMSASGYSSGYNYSGYGSMTFEQNTSIIQVYVGVVL